MLVLGTQLPRIGLDIAGVGRVDRGTRAAQPAELLAEPVSELQLLRAENIRLSHPAELAEALAAERAEALTDMQSVLAKLPPMLEAGRPRRWFRRRRSILGGG